MKPVSNSLKRRSYRLVVGGLVGLWLTVAMPSALSQSPQYPAVADQHSAAPQQVEQGRSHYAAGEFEQAIAIWQHAAQFYAGVGNAAHQGRVLIYLSLAYQHLEQWPQADATVRQGLALIQQALADTSSPEHHHLYAQALTTQGRLQLSRGQADAALDSWRLAADLYGQIEDGVGWRGSLINQAAALEILGFYRQSCKVLLTTLHGGRRCEWSDDDEFTQIVQAFAADPDPQIQVLGLRTLGNLLRSMGDLARSHQVLRRGVAVVQPLKLPRQEAALLLGLGETERALYERAKTQFVQARPVDAGPMLEQGMMALATYQQAVEHAGQAASSAPNLIQIQAQLQRLSLLLDLRDMLQFNGDKVNRDFGDELNIEPDTIGAQATALLAYDIAGLPPSQPAIYASLNFAQSLMRVSALDGQVQDGDWVRAAFRQANIAVQNAEVLGDERAQSHALGMLGELYNARADWPHAQQTTQAALAIAQRLQARDLGYRWQWQLAQIYDAQGETQSAIGYYQLTFDTLQSLRRDLTFLSPEVQFSFRENIEPVYRQLVGLLLRPDDPDAIALRQARQVIDSLQVSEVENFLQQTCSEAELATIDRVVEQSDSAAALIYTIVLDNQLDIIVKLPQAEAFRFHRVWVAQEEVEETLTSLRRAVQQKLVSQLPALQQTAQQVYDWLIAPFEADLDRYGIDTLVFVLDGQLQNSPMAALYDGETYLIQNYAVTTIPGLTLLTSPALGNQSLRALVAGLIHPPPDSSLGALPAVAQEVKSIQQALGHTDVLQDRAFTYAALQRRMNRRSAPIVHLATHGQFSSQPEDTFIVMGDGDRLSLAQLGELLSSRDQTRPNPIQLLFLSACQTVAGDKRAALGMAGVAVRSGARSTIASLWQVDDEATAELVGLFYHYLADPAIATKAEALQLAQQELLENPRFSLPVYWSAFVLLGNWF
ncbi:MAG: CHAT domain-containing protein [Elainellaceae cyanobacterium]